MTALTSLDEATTDPQQLAPANAQAALAAAKAILASMPWFALHERFADSVFALDTTFRVDTAQLLHLWTKDREAVPRQTELDADVLAAIQQHNQLDLVRFQPPSPPVHAKRSC